jgi:hypothetical protein
LTSRGAVLVISRYRFPDEDAAEFVEALEAAGWAFRDSVWRINADINVCDGTN